MEEKEEKPKAKRQQPQESIVESKLKKRIPQVGQHQESRRYLN